MIGQGFSHLAWLSPQQTWDWFAEQKGTNSQSGLEQGSVMEPGWVDCPYGAWPHIWQLGWGVVEGEMTHRIIKDGKSDQAMSAVGTTDLLSVYHNLGGIKKLSGLPWIKSTRKGA